MANRMKRYARMTLAANRGGERSERNGVGMTYPNMNYEMRGNGRYNSGRYGPMRNDTNIEIEGRFRDDRIQQRENEYGMSGEPESRRRRDSRGRFRSEWEDGMESRGNYGNEARMEGYPGRPFPVYKDGDQMNQIGFIADRPEIRNDYGMNANYGMGSEMEYRTSPRMSGGASSHESMPMTKEMAEEWTHGMKNEDGTKGPHWTMEQIKQVMAQKGIECDPLEMFAIMNALYSDYCAVLKKYGMNKADVYADLACAWLNDKDAVKNKASAYYEHIVKK